MAIGAVPLIPMYRVQTNPDARFQRFGLNDSQLYGKPMISFTAPEARPAHPVVAQPQAKELAVRSQQGVATKPVEVPEWATGYTGWSGAPSAADATAKPGALLDVKA